MSELIKHECGVAMIRLLKPLSYYKEKYGTYYYGLHKLYMLMEKQSNRGQDGAGIATIKLDMPPGQRYISRARSNDSGAVKAIFKNVFEKLNLALQHEKADDVAWLKSNYGFVGEVLLGHLRYGTFGANNIESCHPFLRQNNWMTRNLVLAGNFNLTNTDELFQTLVDLGQHPKEKADTVTMLEKIGHFLDVENQRIFKHYNNLNIENKDISRKIADEMNIATILKNASNKFDGGYTICGMLGHGDAFVLRDPNAIRPCYYYFDDEVVVVASEKPAIQTVFNVGIINNTKIKELDGGHALIIKKNGEIAFEKINEPKEKKSCSFERIYFSRATDADIYKERKKLGEHLVPAVMESIEYDVQNTVFSYIPNTAEIAFSGLIDGLNAYLHHEAIEKILALKEQPSEQELQKILSYRPRVEKIANKDVKLRTFISDGNNRKEMVNLVYDTTYGLVKEYTDNLVVVDDSIVRGTTLKQSIIGILDRLCPKRIIIVSSAPQIRYPDCYGIDMSRFSEFIAWKALHALLLEDNKQNLIDDCYNKCKNSLNQPKEIVINHVKELYSNYSDEIIADKISTLLTPEFCKAEIKIIFQKIEGLHNSCPQHLGDWYFTGNYPTPGGNKVVNRAFVYWYEKLNDRPY